METAIQNALATIFKAVALTGIALADIGKIREQPKVDSVIDAVPCVLICPRGAPMPEGLNFEGGVSRVYVEEIIVIAGREGDAATNQAPTQTWYEQCIHAAQKNTDGSWRTTIATVPSVYDIRVSDSLPGFDRSKLSDNYAYLSFFVTVRSSE